MEVLINNFYINARVAQLSNRLFGSDKYNRLTEATDLAGAVKVLQEVQYGGGIATDDFELLLQNELYEAVALLRQLCINNYEADFFLCKYDYHNAKVLTKCKYGRLSAGSLCFECAMMPSAKMQELIIKDDYSQFSSFMAQALEKIDQEFANGNRSPRLIDIELDRAMFLQMQSSAKKSRLAALKDYCSFMIDAVNIMLLFRCRKNGLPIAPSDFVSGGKLDNILKDACAKELTDIEDMFFLNEYQPLIRLCIEGVEKGSLSQAQYYISQRKMDTISKDASQESSQPLLVYFAAKLAEIERIRFIMICIKYGTDKEQIKDMLGRAK